MQNGWYFERDGHISGPFGAKDLASLGSTAQILPTDLVWRSDSTERIPASCFEGIFRKVGAAMTQKVQPILNPIYVDRHEILEEVAFTPDQAAAPSVQGASGDSGAVQAAVVILAIGLGIWLLVCWFKGFGCINTRIDWPWAYWHQGWWVIFGFLAICFLIFLGFIGVLASSDQGAACQPPFFFGLAAWFLAALLLQAMPEAQGGIQFVPRLPWSYSGWFATTVCTIMWLLLAVGFAAMLGPTPEGDVAMSVVVVIVAVILNALLTFWSPPSVSAQDRPVATCKESVQGMPAEGPNAWAALLTSCKDLVARMEHMKTTRMTALEKLSEDQESLRSRIRALGIRDKRELLAHKAGQALAQELLELAHDITRVAGEAEVYKAAVENADSQVRRIERRMMLDQLGVPTTEEANRLARTKYEVEDNLRKVAGARTPGSEVTDDKLLDKVLAGSDR